MRYTDRLTRERPRAWKQRRRATCPRSHGWRAAERTGPQPVAPSPALSDPLRHLPCVVVIDRQPTSPEHTAGPAPRSPSAFAVTVPLRSIFRRCFLITPSHEAAAPTDKLCVSASVPSTESRILSPALTRRQIPSLWGDGAPRRMRVPPGGAHAALTAAPLLT